MAAQTWRLKRFGHLVAVSTGKEATRWKIIEAKDNEPDIVLTIVESGHLLVSQGQQCLETVMLLGASECLKVHQKSDNLVFRFTVKGESQVMRMQFSGIKREEAINECSSAVVKLREYVPVTMQDNAARPPTEITAPVIQSTQHGDTMEVEPEVVVGSLSIKCLTQHFLGERAVTLPLQYPHSFLPEGDLELFLRVCLLDPSFPALVERVEGELKKLLQE
ncbi:meiotic recombination protein REC114 [Genypterus blacodes]|uniref:meiotic recombination protein REC114 n=1 Tax=Genypterus blacodes TaxID=154954 RepID=UPI003F75DE5E